MSIKDNKQLYAYKFDNIKLINLLKTKNYQISTKMKKIIYISIIIREIKLIIQKFLKNNSPGPDDFTRLFQQMSKKKKKTPIFYNLSQKVEVEEIPNSFYDTSITLIKTII